MINDKVTLLHCRFDGSVKIDDAGDHLQLRMALTYCICKHLQPLSVRAGFSSPVSNSSFAQSYPGGTAVTMRFAIDPLAGPRTAEAVA